MNIVVVECLKHVQMRLERILHDDLGNIAIAPKRKVITISVRERNEEIVDAVQ